MNSTAPPSFTLGFIGAGNMAEAIAQAAIRQGVLEPAQMIAADPSEARRAVFAALGVATTDSNAQVARQSGQVLLAVKPQAFGQVADELAANLQPGQVVISIMAGLRGEKLAGALKGAGGSPRIVRVMPNTPMLVGAGMSAVALGPGAKAGDDALTMQLLEAGGRAIRVAEAQLDAITAVSGSGPAYAFYLAEAMERVAHELGLGEHARLLVSQTLRGAAAMLAESELDPAELRRRVTSPGGTTEAAIRHMDERGVGDAIAEAMHAAEARSRELAG